MFYVAGANLAPAEAIPVLLAVHMGRYLSGPGCAPTQCLLPSYLELLEELGDLSQGDLHRKTHHAPSRLPCALQLPHRTSCSHIVQCRSCDQCWRTHSGITWWRPVGDLRQLPWHTQGLLRCRGGTGRIWAGQSARRTSCPSCCWPSWTLVT